MYYSYRRKLKNHTKYIEDIGKEQEVILFSDVESVITDIKTDVKHILDEINVENLDVVYIYEKVKRLLEDLR